MGSIKRAGSILIGKNRFTNEPEETTLNRKTSGSTSIKTQFFFLSFSFSLASQCFYDTDWESSWEAEEAIHRWRSSAQSIRLLPLPARASLTPPLCPARCAAGLGPLCRPSPLGAASWSQSMRPTCAPRRPTTESTSRLWRYRRRWMKTSCGPQLASVSAPSMTSTSRLSAPKWVLLHFLSALSLVIPKLYWRIVRLSPGSCNLFTVFVDSVLVLNFTDDVINGRSHFIWISCWNCYGLEVNAVRKIGWG